jgi:membrane-associated protein
MHLALAFIQARILSLTASIVAIGIDPKALIEKFGRYALIGVFLVVFAETGILVGFFLPGDSLLFTVGLLIATKTLDAPISVAVVGIITAAIIGDQVGYQIGSRIGPSLFTRPKSKLFNPKHVERAQQFFDRHGPRTIILARFVPIIRTFAPVVAGVAKMPLKQFTLFNVVGGFVWGGGVTLAGYALGKRFPWLSERIELLALVIVGISILPVLFDVRRHLKEKKAGLHG